jgi:hypothetical protein
VPPSVKAETYHLGFFVDPALIETDPHFEQGCTVCHQGDESATDMTIAHKGMQKRPSDDLSLCGQCHGEIAATYAQSLHYTSAGQRHGVIGRFSKAEVRIFDEKVFEQSCRTCHASCGDCHVKSPVIGGISLGLIEKHQFVRRKEGKTCAFCHGGRVYPEFTGEYSGSADVHYQKGMLCVDCHPMSEFHGDGTAQTSKEAVKDRPRCLGCHKIGEEKKESAKISHEKHVNRASCQACHAAGQYRNCYDCHPDTGSKSKPGFLLGKNPRNMTELTTLRLIPTVRDTFAKAGIRMETYDALPNYWDSAVHSIRKRTARTRDCNICHVEKKDFLTREMLIPEGSKANETLIFSIKPIPEQK